MYIKSIKLNNFQCYYGDDNLIEFSEGLNLILGSINKGKSKLFDAFYWVLFGEIFITGDDWVKTDDGRLGISFINDKAKCDTNPGDSIFASVEIVINHIKDHFNVDYTISRKVKATFKSGESKESWFNNKSWLVSKSNIDISYQNSNGDYIIIDTPYDVNLEISSIFPKEIRNYCWFQGEALNKLIDFSNPSTFEQAIKHISYYPYYEKLSSLTELIIDIISKEKNRKINESTRDKNNYQKLNDDLILNQGKLLDAKKDLNEQTIKHEELSKAEEDIRNQLTALHEFPPFEKRKALLESELRNIKKDLDIVLNEQKEQFHQSWMLRGSIDMVRQAKEKIIDFDRQRLNDDNYTLPDDVPPKVYLEKMIEAKRCLICLTEANEKSEAFKNIQEKIRKQDDYFQKQQNNQDLFSAISQIMSYPDDVLHNIKGIDQQIKSNEDKIEQLISKRNEKGSELRDVQYDIDKLMGKYGISLSDGVGQSYSLNNKLSYFTDKKRQFESKIINTQSKIKEYELIIKNDQEAINNIVLPGSVNIPEKKWYDVTSYLKKTVETVKEGAKLELISIIEKQANEFYHGITKHNRAVDGNITINPCSYQISRTEDNMYQIESGNTGNYTLMKMCIINAMLSLNEKELGVSYPFVADAPTSNLDADTTIAYVKSIANSFNQSIILTKDVNHQDIAQIKEDFDVKTIYELYTKSDNEATDIYKQYESYNKFKKIK